MSSTSSATSDSGKLRAELITFAASFIALQTFILVLFYATKCIRVKRVWGIEIEIFMPLAYVCCTGNAILLILMTLWGGAGDDVYELDMAAIIRLGKLLKAAEIMWTTSVTFPKLVALSLYVRLFFDPIRRLSYLTAVFVVCTCLGMVLTATLECHPFAFSWDKSIPGGHCINLNKNFAYMSIPNLVSDLVILILPLQPLWRLQVPRSSKIGLIATFVIGSSGIVTAVLRFVIYLRADTAEPLFLGVGPAKITVIEPAVYYIAASLPTLRPLLTKIMSLIKIALGISPPQTHDEKVALREMGPMNQAQPIDSVDYHHVYRPQVNTF